MKKWVIVILLIAFSLMLSGCTEQPEEQPEAENENTVTEQKNIVQTAIDAGSFKTLVTAVQTADLVETLSGEGPFTVFAPTDDAFAAVPEETLNALLADKAELNKVLTYHVSSGKYMAEDVVSMENITTLEGNMLDVEVTNEGVFVAGAKVIQTDIQCSNGVIHVIDTVLIPPVETEQKNIVQTAIDAGSFKTLVTAVQTADLVETLSGEGPFTVFAPTDDAFAAVPEETLNALLADKAELTKVLTYHVASGKYMAEDVVSMGNITTLEGNMLDVEITNEGVFVGGAKVIQTDIECSNGVIHVIDTVLIPPANMTS